MVGKEDDSLSYWGFGHFSGAIPVKLRGGYPSLVFVVEHIYCNDIPCFEAWRSKHPTVEKQGVSIQELELGENFIRNPYICYLPGITTSLCVFARFFLLTFLKFSTGKLPLTRTRHFFPFVFFSRTNNCGQFLRRHSLHAGEVGRPIRGRTSGTGKGAGGFPFRAGL